MNPTLVQTITFAIAVLGAALGVLNFWRSWNNDRVRVEVLPMAAQGNDGSWYVSVEIRNLSTFAVTIKALGLTSSVQGQHMQLPWPMFTRKESLPVRLESRTSATALIPIAANQHALANARRVYVDTACGRRITATSVSLRGITKLAAADITQE